MVVCHGLMKFRSLSGRVREGSAGLLPRNRDRAAWLSCILNLVNIFGLCCDRPCSCCCMHVRMTGVPGLAVGAAVIPAGDLVAGATLTVVLIEGTGAVVGQVTVVVTAARRLTEATGADDAVISAQDDESRSLQRRGRIINVSVTRCAALRLALCLCERVFLDYTSISWVPKTRPPNPIGGNVRERSRPCVTSAGLGLTVGGFRVKQLSHLLLHSKIAPPLCTVLV